MMRKSLNRHQLIQRLGKSGRALDRMIASGQIPPPTGRVGHMSYWNVATLEKHERQYRARQATNANASVTRNVVNRCETEDNAAVCEMCSTPLEETHQNKRYCSRSCRQKAYRARKALAA